MPVRWFVPVARLPESVAGHRAGSHGVYGVTTSVDPYLRPTRWGTMFEMLRVSRTTNASYQWELCVLDSNTPDDAMNASRALAEYIVEKRCGPYFHTWLAAAAAGTPLDGADRRLFLAQLGPPLNRGLLTDIHPDHLQGMVAEYLWLLTVEYRADPRAIRRIEPPGYAPTDAGGDGLVVYESAAGVLTFRLWEIKKDLSQAGVPAKVKEILSQIDERALEYLARYSKVHQDLEAGDPDVASLYASLGELYDTRDDRVGIGASVSTSEAPALSAGDCFAPLVTTFPDFATSSDRLEGILCGVGDAYEAFCNNVWRHVWTGL